MKNLRKSFDLFCFKHRNDGIPNLMLYIVLGNALVMIMSMINGGNILYNILCFDKDSILKGQVWRLITYVFTQTGSGYLSLIFLYFFYMLGRHVEESMGTLKFNLFYFSGIIIMDIFAMIFSPSAVNGGMFYTNNIAYYLHLTMILTYATLYPNSQFMIFFLIPVKAWIIALVYLVLVGIDVINLTFPTAYFPHNLFPIVALANYFLFMGSSIKDLFPKKKKTHKPASKPQQGGKVIHFQTDATAKPNFNHRCSICGRTDASNPELEFRYCSRCNGYHCYCEDHINNHIHVE